MINDTIKAYPESQINFVEYSPIVTKPNYNRQGKFTWNKVIKVVVSNTAGEKRTMVGVGINNEIEIFLAAASGARRATIVVSREQWEVMWTTAPVFVMEN